MDYYYLVTTMPLLLVVLAHPVWLSVAIKPILRRGRIALVKLLRSAPGRPQLEPSVATDIQPSHQHDRDLQGKTL